MEKILTVHEGEFRCRTRNKNGEPIVTDPSKDHGGKEEAYSPVDLLVVSLSSCILTVMAIVAKQHGIDTRGSKVEAGYEMTDKLTRRIGKISLEVSIAGKVPAEKRHLLEKTIHMCPVRNSLHPEMQYDIKVHYLN